MTLDLDLIKDGFALLGATGTVGGAVLGVVRSKTLARILAFLRRRRGRYEAR